MDQANHQKAAYLDHISLAFYRFAFAEFQLPLYFGFHFNESPPQETSVESITTSVKSMLLRLLSVHLSLTLKAQISWKKFLLSAEQSFTLHTEWIKKPICD